MSTRTEDFPRLQRKHPRNFIKPPNAYIADPVSWHPDSGFYRNSSPDVPLAFRTGNSCVHLRVGIINHWWAYGLGQGSGFGGNNQYGKHPAGDIASAAQSLRGIDATLIARLGYVDRSLDWPDNIGALPLHDTIARGVCGILGKHLPESNPWQGVMARIGAGVETVEDAAFIILNDYLKSTIPYSYTCRNLAVDVIKYEPHLGGYFGGLKRMDALFGALKRRGDGDPATVLSDVVDLMEKVAGIGR